MHNIQNMLGDEDYCEKARRGRSRLPRSGDTNCTYHEGRALRLKVVSEGLRLVEFEGEMVRWSEGHRHQAIGRGLVLEGLQIVT
jgi:hypothetical protein